jgi:branched-chain amino acid transport system substrate-binding protein
MLQRLRKLVVIAVATTACVAIAACGDDDSSGGAGSGAQTTAAQTTAAQTTAAETTAASTTAAETKPTKDPIYLGTIQDDLVIDSQKMGLKLAVDGWNKRGGIDGHPIKLDICLTHTDQNASAKCARKYASDPKIVATVGTWTLGGAGVVPVLDKAGIPSFNPTQLTPPDYDAKTYFSDNLGGLNTNGEIAMLTDLLGAKKTAFAVFGNASGLGLAKLIDGGVLKGRGLAPTTVVPLPPEAADFSSQAAKLAAAKADGVGLSGLTQQNANFMRTARGQGVTIPAVLVATGGGPKFWLEQFQGQADNLYLVSCYKLKGPAFEQFLADYKAAGGEDGKWDTTMLGDWAALNMLNEVVKAGAPVTREGLLAGVQKVSGYDAGGMVEPIDFSKPAKILAFNHIFANSMVGYKLTKDGDLEPVKDGQFFQVFK